MEREIMDAPEITLEQVLAALSAVRAPIQREEYDLHGLLMRALAEARLPVEHEVRIAPRCRIDLLCGRIGIEVKRGRPEHGRLLTQLRRYAASPEVDALILVSERNVALPGSIGGKPLCALCLNRLWGIAL